MNDAEHEVDAPVPRPQTVSSIIAMMSHAGDDPTDDPTLPRPFGEYTLLRSIGEGSFGEVFLAHHDRTWQQCAIKVLTDRRQREEGSVRRFGLEVQIGSELRHPNILPVTDHGICNDQLFMVMPFIDGTDLERLIARRPLETDQAVEMLRTIATAVHAAHEAGYLHRDIKPANILVASDAGVPYLADFGLAKATNTPLSFSGIEDVIGTQPYMPPEQIDPVLGEVSASTDVYALGVTLYQALTGGPPFPRQDRPDRDIRRQIAWDQPLPPSTLNPDISADLDMVCLVCLQKSRYDRYQSAAELAADLHRVQQGRPVEARLPGRMKRAWRHCQRRPVQTVVMLILAVATTVGVVTAGSYATRAQHAESRLSGEQQRADTADSAAEQARLDTTVARESEAREQHLRQLRDYLADMQLLRGMWESGDAAAVRAVLDSHRPEPGVPDLRGFEWYYWNNTLAVTCERLDSSMRAHAMEIAPGGTRLAISDGMTIELWDVAGRRLEHSWSLAGGKAAPRWRTSQLRDRSIAFSPDGRYLAAVMSAHNPMTSVAIPIQYKSMATLWVWDLEAMREVLSVRHRDDLSGRSIAFTPDGRHVVAGGFGGMWRAWELSDSPGSPAVSQRASEERLSRSELEAVQILFDSFGQTPENAVREIRFDEARPEGFQVVCGDREAEWSWPEGRMLTDAFIAQGVSGESPAGRLFGASASRRTAPVPNGHNLPYGVMDVVESAQGVVVGCGDRIVRFWPRDATGSLASRPLEYRGVEGPIACVSARNSVIACADSRGRVYIWRTAESDKLPRLDLPRRPGRSAPDLPRNYTSDRLAVPDVPGVNLATGDIVAHCFSPDKRILAVVYARGRGVHFESGEPGIGPAVHLYETTTGSAMLELGSDFFFAPDAISFSADGRLCVIGNSAMTALYDTATGSIVSECPKQAVHLARLSHDGRHVILGLSDGWGVWDALSGTWVHRGEGKVEDAVFLGEEGRVLITLSSDQLGPRRLAAVDLPDGTLWQVWPRKQSDRDFFLSHDGRRLYSQEGSEFHVYSSELADGFLVDSFPTTYNTRIGPAGIEHLLEQWAQNSNETP